MAYTPGFVWRNNQCRDSLAGWLCEMCGPEAVTIEKHIPGWDRMTSESLHHAVLDVFCLRQRVVWPLTSA